jgi:hypothetical protein
LGTLNSAIELGNAEEKDSQDSYDTNRQSIEISIKDDNRFGAGALYL